MSAIWDAAKTNANACQLSPVYLEGEGFKRGSAGGHQGVSQVFLASPQDFGSTTSRYVAACCTLGENHHSPDDG